MLSHRLVNLHTKDTVWILLKYFATIVLTLFPSTHFLPQTLNLIGEITTQELSRDLISF